ncbi:MAG TPA: hypothetical protein VFB43_06920 [Terracidiphilus sp.]|nr:hypothetical protein [Terracidiphilus sp.]
MSEQRSKRTETEELTRIDTLVNLLKYLSRHDPPPALRERLAVLASERLKEDAPQSHATRWKVLGRLRPAFAAAILIAAGLATVLVVHFRQHGPEQIHGTASVAHSAVSPEVTAQISPSAQPTVDKHSRFRRAQPRLVKPATTRQLTIRLPYSNGAIETGTDTTIRVSIFQSELVSLGFPINRTVRDRRIVAELTLGDDGLPRAISVPLPLEVMKEKK